MRPFSRCQSSGRCRFGSHCPFSSRREKTRSLARDRSSSRRAPPNAASNPPAASASSSAWVLSSPQQRWVPTRERLRAVGDGRGVGVHDQPRADLRGVPVAEVDHLAELVGRVDVQQRERDRSGMERLLRQAQEHRRVLADRIEHHRAFELGHHLAHDVDALGLEHAQVVEGRGDGRGRRQGLCLHRSTARGNWSAAPLPAGRRRTGGAAMHR